MKQYLRILALMVGGSAVGQALGTQPREIFLGLVGFTLVVSILTLYK